MEWLTSFKSDRLQEKVHLIQVASGSTTALFHIGLHTGTITDDLIAPFLQKIIQSANIVKTGVATVNADFSRLEKHFRLKLRGGFGVKPSTPFGDVQAGARILSWSRSSFGS
jgi:hypothetical protein